MNALVLGGTGFIGGHIARAASEAGWQVAALRRNPGLEGNLTGAPVEWVHGDLEDQDTLLAAMRGSEVVFHAAAYYPKSKDRLGVGEHVSRARREIDRVLRAAAQAGVGRLVFTSTLTTIGRPPPEEDRLADEMDEYRPGTLPDNAYYEAKINMERAVLEAAAAGLPAVVLNPTLVLGPGDVHLSSTRFLLFVLRGWALASLPVTVNIVDVRDNAAAHLRAATKGQVGQRYIIGGHNLSLTEALSMTARLAGTRTPRFEIPLPVVAGLAALAGRLPGVRLSSHLKALAHWQGYDTAKARRALGLSARPLDETLRDTIAWLRKGR